MYVIKRNGKLEKFNKEKIVGALKKTFGHPTDETLLTEIDSIADYLEEKYKKRKIEQIHVEDVQDDVELMLMRKAHYSYAKSFITYRNKKTEQRENPWADNDDRQDIILEKYLIDGETKKDFITRIGYGHTSLEKIFRNREAIWGGRLLFAIGRDGNITGSNCYVATDPEDSLEDIYRADYEIAKTYSYGGGQGLNLSKLRPKGAKVNNTSNTTAGIMVFAEKYSHTTLNTHQKNRRGALMLVLNIDHPDAIDFITAKLDLNKINGANISLAVTDDFMEKFNADQDWVMNFDSPHETIKKIVSAKDLMKLISYSAHTMGDPGVLFIDKINNYHLLSEYPNVSFSATNPCGEQPLMANGSCNLASINLNAFVVNPFTEEAYFNYDRFSEVVKEMIWHLDEMLTILGERHPLVEQRKHVKDWREVGLGIMGLADLALGLSKGYGTEPFLKELEKIMRTMANAAAISSALKAKSHGTFQNYNYEYISSSSFYKFAYDKKTKDLIKKHGLRNSRLLSIAPTGSISNIIGVSGGVEPYFMLGYQRTITSMFESDKTVWVYEKTPLKLMKHLKIDHHEKLPEWATITSQNISFDKRADVQSLIQKYVDTAISSTFNLPNETSTEEIEKIYLTSWQKGFKGVTVFRDNCKKIGILTGGGEHLDKNPAEKPSVKVYEKWYDKITHETREFVTVIQINEHSYSKVQELIELCPECNSPLIKKEGCTSCSNLDCFYEKCAI